MYRQHGMFAILQYGMFAILFVMLSLICIYWYIFSNNEKHIENSTPMYVPASYDDIEIIPIVNPQQHYCMTLNIYREAANQKKDGMIAVANVVKNRVKHRRYPNTICEVIYQGPVIESWTTKGRDMPIEHRVYYPVRHKCQFSWYCDGKIDEPPVADKKWKMASDIAYEVMAYGRWDDIAKDATHYHADYANPFWNRYLQKVSVIDNHIFYKE